MEHYIGAIGGALTTLCFVPQAWKVITTRKTEDLSLWTYILFSTGVAFWLAYGFLISSPPVIIANGVTLPLALTILFVKIKEG